MDRYKMDKHYNLQCIASLFLQDSVTKSTGANFMSKFPRSCETIKSLKFPSIDPSAGIYSADFQIPFVGESGTPCSFRCINAWENQAKIV